MKNQLSSTRLYEAVLRQELASSDPRVARAIARTCTIREFAPGHKFIKEGEKTDAAYLILRGTATISIKGQVVATRSEGQHVGEMATLLHSRRTASVTASNHVLVAQISGSDFERLASKFPSIWRGVARTLATRLDQRRNLIREPNTRPEVFIASSTETKSVAHTLKKQLADLRWTVEVWDEDAIFRPSSVTIQTLLTRARRADFGIVVFGRDDQTISRRRKMDAPRDNVVFEAGLICGLAGLERTFLLVPGGVNFKRPSDLDGVTVLRYKKTARTINILNAARRIRAEIETLGVK